MSPRGKEREEGEKVLVSGGECEKKAGEERLRRRPEKHQWTPFLGTSSEG